MSVGWGVGGQIQREEVRSRQRVAATAPPHQQHPRVGQVVCGPPQLVQLLLLGRQLAAQQADVLLLQLAAALAHVSAQLGQ